MAMVVAIAAAAPRVRAGDDDVTPQSGWDTFWNAASDELAGPPDARALAKMERFDRSGISFDYPAVLRLRRDRKTADDAGDAHWNLSRGDFELDLHDASDAFSADAYFEMLGSLFDDERGDVEGPEPGIEVTWCGRTIRAVRLRVTMFGDRHEMLGFGLPAPEGRSRVLLFDDVIVDGAGSTTASATFAAVDRSIRCAAAGS
jgi:hypothetical protein